MIRTLGVIAIVVCVSLPAVMAHDGHAHTVMGTVVTRDATHLEVKTPGGEVLSIQITEKTTFTRAKKKVAAEDVKVGGRVVVDIGNGEDPLIARSVQVGTATPAKAAAAARPADKP
jgi:hypothetical protein